MAIMQKILVPIDGTEYSWRALEYAAGLASLSGGGLYVVTVVTEEGGSPSGSAPLRSHEEQEADDGDETTVMQIGNDVLNAAQALLGSHPSLDCNYILMRDEDVAAAILEAVSVNGCDAIVLGCRAKSLFQQLLRRSVSQSVLEEAGVPVLLVK